MAYENLIVEKRGHICIITFNHPPVNAWNWGMMADFEKAIDEIENDEAVRVVIITGGGEKAFSAGFDLSDSANSYKTSPKGRDLWTRFDRFAKPVIAAINGHVLAGGLELALSCHCRSIQGSRRRLYGLFGEAGTGIHGRINNIIDSLNICDALDGDRSISKKYAVSLRNSFSYL